MTHIRELRTSVSPEQLVKAIQGYSTTASMKINSESEYREASQNL
uniref:Uncharacterized protein n=1 Tax=Moniliophthora roreri TaxID=221103 RepID=A0A0W0FQ62_MONRR